MGKIATDASAQELLTLLRTFLNTQQNKVEGEIGTLANLNTSAKGSLVAAMNELVGEDTGIKTRLSAVEAKNTTQDTTLSSHTTSINNFTIWTKGLTLNNAISHNSIVRGKNLGAFTAAHSAAIQAGTFNDMFLGDYFTMPSGFTPTYWKDPDWGIPKFRIAGFHHWGSSSGLLLIADVAFKSTVGMWHDNDYTEGYAACKWREVDKPLLEAEAANIFIDETHLIKHYEKLTGATDPNGVVSAMVNVSDSCVEIPSLTQILGYTYKNDTTNLTGNTDTTMEGQFELFRHMNPSLILGAPWGCTLRTVSHHYVNFGFNTNIVSGGGLNSESIVTNPFRSFPYITVK